MAMAIGISLAWHFIGTGLKLFFRKRDIRREEFNSNIRPGINSALSDLATARSSVLSFSDSRLKGEEFTSELFNIQTDQFTPAYEKLSGALGRADLSRHVKGNNWQEILRTAEDAIYASFNALANQANDDERQYNFANLVGAFTQLERDLNAAIDKEIR